jgi:cell division protein FtsB
MKEGVREKFMHNFTIAMIVIIIVGGLVIAYPTYRQRESLKEQRIELESRIKVKRSEIAKLIENQRRFRTDPDFVEAIARQNRRVFPGELVFIFEKE